MIEQAKVTTKQREKQKEKRTQIKEMMNEALHNLQSTKNKNSNPLLTQI